MADVLSVGVNLEAFSQAINAIQALRSSVSRVFDCLKDGMRNKETLEGREKAFIAQFQDNLHSVNRDLNELERLSNLVGKPSENHPLHNSGLLSLDPVQDKTPLYSQLLQAYKWSNKIRRRRDQPHRQDVSRDVHPLVQTQRDLSDASGDPGEGAESDRGHAEPVHRPDDREGLQRERLHGGRQAGYMVQVQLSSVPEGDGPRHHRPAALPAAPDAGRRGQVLHDLAAELHKAVPGPLPALREVPAGRPAAHLEGLPDPRGLPRHLPAVTGPPRPTPGLGVADASFTARCHCRAPSPQPLS
ncbi:mediator of RNA polymerase II transcription subunit 27 isoform X2 [Phyllostomus discolor]|uniref:Mediator of RNA polymerase II transcription subunit 27 n=1 Tax=Phyllostomus discolor TaxID=89673 RepID=A0A7E6DH54_9CHIR|nr:mediator of RNA polymerase II transcription subunit 27 isoform X2 [Phyllostomus discolor]